MHIAGLPELPHTCIYNWNTCLALLPGAQHLWIILPLETGKFGLQGLLGEVRIVIEQGIGKFAPCQLRAEVIHILIGDRVIFKIIKRMPDLVGGNMPQCR